MSTSTCSLAPLVVNDFKKALLHLVHDRGDVCTAWQRCLAIRMLPAAVLNTCSIRSKTMEKHTQRGRVA